MFGAESGTSRRCIAVLAALLIVIPGCGWGPEPQPTTDVTWDVALTGNPEFPVVFATSDQERLVLLGGGDEAPDILDGAVFLAADGSEFVVYIGADGLPSRAVVGGLVFLFANYRDDLVDVARIDPAGAVSFAWDTPVDADQLAQLRSLVTDSSARGFSLLGPLGSFGVTGLKIAGLAVAVAACVIAATGSAGAALLPCGAALLRILELIVPDDLQAELLGAGATALDAFMCLNSGDCVGLILEAASLAEGAAQALLASLIDAISGAESNLAAGPGGDDDDSTPPGDDDDATSGDDDDTTPNPGPQGLSFVSIPAGTFTMGCTAGQDNCFLDESPTHAVTVSRAFSLMETEVTQGQWIALMGNNPSDFSTCGTDCPLERVNWYEALAFANALSGAEGLPVCFTLEDCERAPGEDMRCDTVNVNTSSGSVYDCAGFRLPTEAEWEYAARAGTDLLYAGSNTIDNVAWWGGNSGAMTHPVAQKAPNGWGLYDMSGNVWEWTWDWYLASYYDASPAIDPEGPATGSDRSARGGSWYLDKTVPRHISTREDPYPGYRGDITGLRLARTGS